MTIIEAHQENIEEPKLSPFEYVFGFTLIFLIGLAVTGLGLALGAFIFNIVTDEPMQPSWNYYLTNPKLDKNQMTLSGGVKINGVLE